MDAATKAVGVCLKVVNNSLASLSGFLPQQQLIQEAKKPSELVANEMQSLVRSTHPMLRIAGLSGASAVILGAYGAHGL